MWDKAHVFFLTKIQDLNQDIIHTLSSPLKYNINCSIIFHSPSFWKFYVVFTHFRILLVRVIYIIELFYSSMIKHFKLNHFFTSVLNFHLMNEMTELITIDSLINNRNNISTYHFTTYIYKNWFDQIWSDFCPVVLLTNI